MAFSVKYEHVVKLLVQSKHNGANKLQKILPIKYRKKETYLGLRLEPRGLGLGLDSNGLGS